MEFNGIPWNSVENSMGFHGKFNGIPWNSIEFHGIPLNFLTDFFIIFFHGIPWKIPWNSMEFNGIP
jgi:hypothetical protein